MSTLLIQKPKSSTFLLKSHTKISAYCFLKLNAHLLAEARYTNREIFILEYWTETVSVPAQCPSKCWYLMSRNNRSVHFSIPLGKYLKTTVLSSHLFSVFTFYFSSRHSLDHIVLTFHLYVIPSLSWSLNLWI